jgi:biopolymer transport protein ExbD
MRHGGIAQEPAGRRHRRTQRDNVTPFIDVMLVLLIIFMLAAPLSTIDIAVDLPVSNAQPQPRPDKPVFLTVKQDLTLALGNEEVRAPRCRRRWIGRPATTASSACFCAPTGRWPTTS